ncbi:MAG: response regulator [Magnetococcus sp. DMHC-6]
MSAFEKKLKIMIVDDEEIIQNSIDRFLAFQPQFQDAQIILASSFTEALDKVEEFSPLIILQDINLPDGNGLQFIRQIKQTYPYIQFIVITGASDLNRVMEALSFGASDYIKKPIDMEQLSTMIQEAKNRCDRWGELLWNEYQAEESMPEGEE